MTKSKGSPKVIRQDAERLAAESAFTEVWEHFEETLLRLKLESPESSALLTAYLNGTPERELAQQNHLTEKEARSWIRKIKRDLLHQLRKTCKVRQ